MMSSFAESGRRTESGPNGHWLHQAGARRHVLAAGGGGGQRAGPLEPLPYVWSPQGDVASLLLVPAASSQADIHAAHVHQAWGWLLRAEGRRRPAELFGGWAQALEGLARGWSLGRGGGPSRLSLTGHIRLQVHGRGSGHREGEGQRVEGASGGPGAGGRVRCRRRRGQQVPGRGRGLGQNCPGP